MFKSLKNRFAYKGNGAYPGDTYIRDLYDAANSGRPWVKYFYYVLILAFFADLYFLYLTVVFVVKDGTLPDFLADVFSLIIAATLVVLYLFVSITFGNKLKEFIAFRDRTSLVSTIIAFVVLILALYGLTIFRLALEISSTEGLESRSILHVATGMLTILRNPAYVDPASRVFVMTLVMLLSAFIGSIYAYYKGDAVTEKIYRVSLASLAEDKALYNKIFFKNSNNEELERQYEAAESQLDKKAVSIAFRLGSLASQLNGMVDPADAHEFLEAQKLISAEYFRERG